MLVAGTLLGMSARFQAERAHAELDRWAPDQVLEFVDAQMTAGERLQQFDRRVLLAFGIPYLLAVIMLVLFFWSRRSPVPALITALVVYVLLAGADAMADPGTLQKGLLMKGLVLCALGGGVVAAWRQREADADAQHRQREAGRMAKSNRPR